MTYRELLAELGKLSEKQLDMDVTVDDVLSDESYPARFDICAEDHGRLEEDHPVIVF